jgi:polysaccharide biosynthesis/export protein
MVKKLHRAWFAALALGFVCAANQGTAFARPAQEGAPGTAPPAQQPTGLKPVQPPAAPPATGQPRPQPATPGAKPPALPTQETPLPSGYVIGPDDVLLVRYWRNDDMSAEVTVRPDGLISLPLLNELQAGGLTPEQLREKVSKSAMKFLEEAPTVAVVVKAINSRKVYVTGMVAKPGYYQLTGAMTVVQLLATAGGIQEFADSKNISIVRNENGRQVAYAFNYKDFLKRRNLKQNIELKPGDTIVVP